MLNKGYFWCVAIFIAACIAKNEAVEIKSDTETTLILVPTANGINLLLKQDSNEKLVGTLGVGTDFSNSSCIGRTRCVIGDITLSIEPVPSGFRITWETQSQSVVFQDCYDLKLRKWSWYGGPERGTQNFPLDQLIIDGADPHIISKYQNFVGERYWLNSLGVYIFVDERAPLFVDQNTEYEDRVCFVSKLEDVYANRERNVFNYTIVVKNDPKEAHLHAVNNYLGKPTGYPDERMIRKPIWTTWAKYKRDISDDTVLSFAQDIKDQGYVGGQIEIDDNWEECYGTQVFNSEKFANITNTVSALKEMGFRVTLWVHPFVNNDCKELAEEGKKNGYFAKSIDGTTDTEWWNGIDSNQIDFTNPEAGDWFSARLQKLQDDIGIDSFKFDAGEADYGKLPFVYDDIEAGPNILTQSYLRTCAKFGNLIEARSAWRTQDLPIFTRIIDKDSVWGEVNGLYALTTTLLQMNMNGYPFVLPDMIGGNGYNEPPTLELLVRWTQANTFMPAMQFSYLPWELSSEDFDGPAIVKKFIDLHEQYSDVIIEAMEASVETGSPVNAPVWWIDPTDTKALFVADGYFLWLAIFSVAFIATNDAVEVKTDTDITLIIVPTTNGINLVINQDSNEKLVGTLGVGTDFSNSSCIGRTRCVIGDITLSIESVPSGFRITWESQSQSVVFQDCYDLKLKKWSWYGGPERKTQNFPLDQLIIDGADPYIISKSQNFVGERYWLNSLGVYIFVDDRAPLFVDQNTEYEDKVCFASKLEDVYVNRERNFFNYTIIVKSDPKQAHLHAVNNFLGKPTGYPDERMIREPIWTTWAKYKKSIDDETVLSFARDIKDQGYGGQIEIDDNWEECYGTQLFDSEKFANITNTVSALKEMGFRVTLWVHPFVNSNCKELVDEGKKNGYFANNLNGTTDAAWWDGTDSNLIDFTNPEASDWFTSRVKKLQDDIGVDSFKFDAGEGDYGKLPFVFDDAESGPNIITGRYLRTCATFGNLIEIRTAWRTQDLPVFIRMVDKESVWGEENGLYALTTTLLQMNMNGYTLVLPDMIGGNGYKNTPPTLELIVRWTQANTFMPAMQFSYLPWDLSSDDFDGPAIVKKFIDLHEQYSDVIIEAMEASVETGSPVNAPVWWIDPTDKKALFVADEYLLGEKILVAPIYIKGATSRSVYLPKGLWEDGNNGTIYEGPLDIYEYSVPIDTLAYFIRQPDNTTYIQ